jgi:hypothetical protein
MKSKMMILTTSLTSANQGGARSYDFATGKNREGVRCESSSTTRLSQPVAIIDTAEECVMAVIWETLDDCRN